MNVARRAPPRWLGVLLLGLLAAPATAGSDGPATAPASQPTAAITDAQFDEALVAAANTQPGLAPFNRILQSVASRFPLLTVATEPGQCVWNELTLNDRGRKVDAFRFRVPDGPPRDMIWTFLSVDLRYEWYIIPLSGEMVGFKRNWYYKPKDILGARSPSASRDMVLQSLPASNLKPGEEYIVWIKLRHARARSTYVAINLLPAADDPAEIESPAHLARELGLSSVGPPIDAIALDVNPSTRPTTAPRKARKKD